MAPKKALHQVLVQTALAALSAADVVVWLVGPRPPDPDDQVRSKSPDDRPRLGEREGKPRQRRDRPDHPPPHDAPNPDGGERESLARHHAGFQAAGGAHEEDLDAGPQARELVRQGDPGVQVPPGSPAGDEDPHRTPRCREMLNRIPTAKRLTTRDDPP